jgi:anti-sigma B factor antagonist
MKIKFREQTNIAILDLKGKLSGTPMNSRVYEAVFQLIQLGKVDIILNLTEVTHIDALGVGDLISCRIQAMKETGNLKLASASKKVLDFLKKVDLNTYFEMYDEETEAIKSFSVDKSN